MSFKPARIFILLVSLFVLSASPPVSANDSLVLRATLKNGLRVVIVRNSLAPVVTTEINYLAGANETPKGFPGTAHAQEHMMFRGSPGLSADQLSYIVASLGGDFNADTRQTVTQYFLTVPADDLDIALHIGSIRMRGVLDSEEQWEKERGAIEQEVAQDLSNPEYVFYKKLRAAMFEGTPYAHDALGTRPSFNKTTGAMLKKFYNDWYGPNNAILIIAGDVDPCRTLATVKDLFGDIPSRPLPERPRVDLRPLKPVSMEMKTDLPYGLSVVAYRMPGFDSADYAAGQVLADVLDSQRGSLYALVPEGKALSAGFDIETLPRAGMGYVTAAFPQGGDGKVLISTIKKRIADYLKKGIPADLVEAAKRHEIADAEFGKNSVSGLASWWSQALAVEGRNSPGDDISAIRKVSPGDVDRVAKKYLLNDTAVVAVLTPQASGKAVSSREFGGRESFTPQSTKPITVPDWAKKITQLPAVPAATVKPSVTVLPNGLKLIVQRETVSPTVSVYGRVKTNHDMQAPNGKEGISRILGNLFSYGTKSLGRLAFQKALDDIAANESAGTSFQLQVLKDRFDAGARLLAENLLEPAFPGQAFEVIRKQTIAALPGELKSPRHLSRRALRAALYPKNDPALRQATPESVSSISLKDVRSYYQGIFRPDMTTVVVIGDVTPADAGKVIKKYFGGWKAEGPKPKTDLPPVPQNKPASVAVPDISRSQVDVTLAQTMGITRFSPDYYALQVGTHVLSSGFYSSRLYRDLREKTGLVYSVGAITEAGRTRSLFAVFYACDPPNVSKARAIVERDLIQMQKEPVSKDELRRTKALLIRRIPLSEASIDGIAGRLLHYSLEGLPLNESVLAAKRYRKMTAQQVKSAFSRRVRPLDFVQVTLGPEPK
ncbi:MAG: pitrilysin family protein [Candidatus Sulfobium sp.]|jgi:zinc protease